MESELFSPLAGADGCLLYTSKEMADAFVDSIIIHGKYDYEIKLVSVSYTHLDVYKRQSRYVPDNFGSGWSKTGDRSK